MGRAVRAVIVDSDTQRALVVQLNDPAIAWSGFITFGGKAEEGETDEAALRRELLEEIGLKEFTLGRDLLVVDRRETPGRPGHEVYIECHVGEFEPRLRSSDPLANPQWVTIDELRELEVDPPQLTDLVWAALRS